MSTNRVNAVALYELRKELQDRPCGQAFGPPPRQRLIPERRPPGPNSCDGRIFHLLHAILGDLLPMLGLDCRGLGLQEKGDRGVRNSLVRLKGSELCKVVNGAKGSRMWCFFGGGERELG